MTTSLLRLRHIDPPSSSIVLLWTPPSERCASICSCLAARFVICLPAWLILMDAAGLQGVCGKIWMHSKCRSSTSSLRSVANAISLEPIAKLQHVVKTPFWAIFYPCSRPLLSLSMWSGTRIRPQSAEKMDQNHRFFRMLELCSWLVSKNFNIS